MQVIKRHVLALKSLILIAGFGGGNNTERMQAPAKNNVQTLESMLINKKPPCGGFLLDGERPDHTAP
jgi:hypothetical protein